MTLRWAAAQAAAGARCVLLPEVLQGGGGGAEGGGGGGAEGGGARGEVEPALADRLYRAASGRRVALDAEGALRTA